MEERYLRKWQPDTIPEHIEIFEGHLHPESLHQEGGSARFGSKVYIVGGSNGTIHHFEDTIHLDQKEAVMKNREVSLGGHVVTIYDMKDMTSTFGPRYPYPANHLSCAKALDGVTMHCTGGFNQAGKGGNKSFSYHYALNTSKENGEWERKADMPYRRGAHGCDFMVDNRMYCVGGGEAQWGPFKTELMIYDPASDKWDLGPPMSIPRDHLYEAVTAIKNGKELYVPGGKGQARKPPPGDTTRPPLVFMNTNVVEIYNLERNEWRRAANLLSERTAVAVVPYHRRGPDKEPNLLLIGGEKVYGFSGSADRMIDEYDVTNDLYYCLEELSWPCYGGGVGIHDGKLHVIGGAEWFGHAASRRVQVYDLEESQGPRQCFYEPFPVFDQWERTWNKIMPWKDFK